MKHEATSSKIINEVAKTELHVNEKASAQAHIKRENVSRAKILCSLFKYRSMYAFCAVTFQKKQRHTETFISDTHFHSFAFFSLNAKKMLSMRTLCISFYFYLKPKFVR